MAVRESSFVLISRDFDGRLIYPDGAMNDGTRHKFELQTEPQNEWYLHALECVRRAPHVLVAHV